jgi:hypothetical protein
MWLGTLYVQIQGESGGQCGHTTGTFEQGLEAKLSAATA